MTDRRPLWIIVLALLGAAAALWGSTQPAGGPGAGGGLALVALAGAGGTVAVGGWARRLVGALVLLTGVAAGWQAFAAASGVGRWLALLGAVLLVLAGVLVVRLAGALPVLGARYRAAGSPGRSGDPDKDMWDGLSEGRDPTLSKADDER